MVGMKKRYGGLQRKAVAVEIKTNPVEMKRFLDQLTDYAKAADEIYLAATPYAIVQYLHKYGRSWYSPKILEDKLEDVGAGLLLVDMSRGEEQCSLIMWRAKTAERRRTRRRSSWPVQVP